jgi:hypothetical protein
VEKIQLSHSSLEAIAQFTVAIALAGNLDHHLADLADLAEEVGGNFETVKKMGGK